MTNYVPLPYSYNNREGEYHHHPPPSTNSTTPLPVSLPLPQELMSISQPETPRPEQSTLSPSSSSSSTIAGTSTAAAANEKLVISPNLIRRRPPTIPSRPANFTTTTFHSNPYPTSGPIRKRRTESIFSFEVGPSFTSTKQLHDLCSMDQSNSYQVQLHAKMDRGFFRADQDWTCYRRNYFQVSSTFDVHGMNYLIQGPEVPCLLRNSDTQEYHQVDYFSIGVCARVTNHDKTIDLVQHTPKRDKGPQLIPEPRPVRAGGNLHLSSVGSNHNIVAFERLQFKTATANNGKKRAAQQYYEIEVGLYANFQRGEPIRVATCTSVPLVVRGRSPGHYADSHTRFKHMETGPSISNEPISSSNGNDTSPAPPVSSALASSNGDQSGSPTIPSRYNASLPNSPISEFSPYSSYNGYTYSSVNGYPPMMPPPPPPLSAGLSPYPPAGSPSSQNGPVPGPYFQNDQAQHHPPPPHIYDNTPPGPYLDSKLLKTEPKSNGYWGNSSSSIYSNDNHPSNNNTMYNMNSTSNNPYGRHHQDGPYATETAGLDAGRPQ